MVTFIINTVSSFADLVLKDKIVVYDLARQQIGWTNYDCKFTTVTVISCKKVYTVIRSVLRLYLLPGSLSVNVSVTTTKDEYINARARQTSESSSKIGTLSNLLPVSIMALSIHIIIFMKSPHL